jgi:gliding motility-associated-like protein
MKKAVHIFSFFVFQFFFLGQVHAQEFYICTGLGALRKVQPSDCSSQLKVNLSTIYSDITFHPSGKLYGVTNTSIGVLHEIDTLTGSGQILTTFPISSGFESFTSLTCNAPGTIYAMSDAGKLYTYNPQTRVRNLVGTVSVNGNVIGAAGDLTFYKGNLYVASLNNSLVKIDLNQTSNSSIYMPFNVGANILGIVSFVDCGQVTTYATSGGASGKVYRIDWANRVLVLACQTNENINGGASRYEFIASVVTLDTIQVVNYTCDKSRENVLPPRTLRNQFGCDSVVLEKTVIAPRINEKTPISRQICFGDTLRMSQYRFYTEGVYSPILKNLYGCDSTVNLSLKLLRRDSTTLRPETCDPKKNKESLIVLKNQLGCDSLIFVKPILIENKNTVNNLPKQIEFIIGDSIQLSPQLNFTPANIQWTPASAVSCANCLSVFSRISKTTRVQFLAKDNKECGVQQEVVLLVNPNRRVFMPNSFSPNGDNVNDVFTFFGDANLQSIMSLKIYDRWGEMVFSGDNLKPNTEGWDGRLRGVDLSPAVFVYWARLRFKDGEEVDYRGDVTLIK